MPADLDADALHQLDYVAELLGVNGARERVCDLVEGEEPLLASFLGKEGYRRLAPLLAAVFFILHVIGHSLIQFDRLSMAANGSFLLPNMACVKSFIALSFTGDPDRHPGLPGLRKTEGPPAFLRFVGNGDRNSPGKKVECRIINREKIKSRQKIFHSGRCFFIFFLIF